MRYRLYFLTQDWNFQKLYGTHVGASGNFVEIYPRWKSGKRAYFSEVVDKYGFPIASKETASKVSKLRHGNLSDRYRNYLLYGDERGKFGMLPKKWRFLVCMQCDISPKCCDILKKEPFTRYVKRDWKKAVHWNYTG